MEGCGRWYFSDDGNRIQLPSSEKSTNIEEMYWQSLQDSQPTRLMSGLISARELMQLFGTDLMRRIFSDKIWVNSCISAIERENPDVALIPDMRFPSEFNPLMDNNAYIIRLMRDVSK